MRQFPPRACGLAWGRGWAGTDNATRRRTRALGAGVCMGASRVTTRHGTRPDNWLSPRLTGVLVGGYLSIAYVYCFRV